MGIGTTNPQYILDVTGTGRCTQPVIVAELTANSHASTKQYEDTSISGVWPTSGRIYKSQAERWG
jgi:hypothetical protein